MNLGIDIGGTRLKIGCVDESGNILASRIVETPTELDTFKRTLLAGVAELAANGPPSAIGIGCKGVIDQKTATVLTLPGSFKFLEGLSFKELLGPVVGDGVPVFADNDARVALAGEVVWGVARGMQNVVMLTLGTGVGGAVLVDGKMMRGAGGAAGLLGHITVVPAGRFCDCGNRGCLETVFSANAIEAEALNVIYRGCESSLTDQFKDNLQRINCKAVFDAAAAGDTIARAIRDDAIFDLAAAIAGLLHVFDPDVVVIGGQIVEAGDSLLAPLQEQVAWRSKRFLNRIVPLKRTAVKESSGIIGAAALALLT